MFVFVFVFMLCVCVSFFPSSGRFADARPDCFDEVVALTGLDADSTGLVSRVCCDKLSSRCICTST